MIVTGAAIGLFIGLVETLLKQAWIRVVQGRNEGREYVISKTRTTIGRDELSDIGLFGDQNVMPLHAVIDLAPSGRYLLRDSGNGAGTLVNGQKAPEFTLRDGDLIMVASMKLEFHEKATASRIPKPVDSAKNPMRIPVADGICPFCGGRKHPLTGDRRRWLLRRPHRS
jgi:pSer/pThr/pTyr-binding forkhead associated (FHA) protein